MFVAYPTVRWGTDKAKSDHSLLLANAQLCVEWADEVKIPALFYCLPILPLFIF